MIQADDPASSIAVGDVTMAQGYLTVDLRYGAHERQHVAVSHDLLAALGPIQDSTMRRLLATLETTLFASGPEPIVGLREWVGRVIESWLRMQSVANPLESPSEDVQDAVLELFDAFRVFNLVAIQKQLNVEGPVELEAITTPATNDRLVVTVSLGKAGAVAVMYHLGLRKATFAPAALPDPDLPADFALTRTVWRDWRESETHPPISLAALANVSFEVAAAFRSGVFVARGLAE